MNIYFTAWPEMLAWPYLILNGWLPYKDIAIAHSPFLLVLLTSFYKLFGLGILQLKVFTWLLIGLNTSLTLYISRKYWGNKHSILSATLYLVLCLIFEGNGLWFDLALTPFALLTYYFIREHKYLLLGLCFASGLLTKQTFIYFLLPIFFSLKASRFEPKYIKKFIFGVSIISLISVVVLLDFGILDDIYLWAVKFGLFYLPKVSGQIQLPNITQAVFALFPFLILVFDSSLALFVIAGVLGVYPRWELFHFQPALPFIAILISKFIFEYKNVVIRLGVVFLLLIYMFTGIKRQIRTETRFYESDVTSVAGIVKKTGYKNIYVANYWDSIYALTDTVPVTKPLIPYIPWYIEYGKNNEVMLFDIKLKQPELIIVNELDLLVWKDLKDFIFRFYTCDVVDKKVEVCLKNK